MYVKVFDRECLKDVLTSYDDLIRGILGFLLVKVMVYILAGLTSIYGNIFEAHQGGLECILLHF